MEGAESSRISRFVVQADWDEALRQKDEKLWIGHQVFGEPTVYADLHPKAMSTEGTIPASHPQFSAKLQNRFLELKYGSSSCSFCVPSSSFKDIHPKKKSVYTMDVSHGGLGVSASSAGDLLVWDTATGSVQRSLTGHCFDVYSCRFFPSGLVVLSGGGDMLMKIWSVDTGECHRTLTGHTQRISKMGIVEKGANILSCSTDGTCRLWNCATGNAILTLSPGAGPLHSLAVAESPVAAPSASSSSSEGEAGTDGKIVLMASEVGRMLGYCLKSRQKMLDMPCEGAASSCAFVNGSRALFGTEKGWIYGVDLRNTKTPLFVRKNSRGEVTSLVPTDKGCFASFTDGSMCYFPLSQESKLLPVNFELTGPDCDPVYEMCTDGTNVYSCCRDGVIRKYAVPVVE